MTTRERGRAGEPGQPHVHRYVIATATVVALVTACGERGERASGVADTREAATETPEQFAPDLRVVLDSMTRTDSGIYIADVRAGTGAVAELGRSVVIEYRAWLPDGTLYEQRPSAEGFGAAELTLGEGDPIGLHHGIAGMKTGGTRRIVVPPDLGYGLVGRPANVPSGSPLLFEVRLRAVR